MSRPDELEALYLEALLRINPQVAHDLRSSLGATRLQVDLVDELLRRGPPGDLVVWDKVVKYVGHAKRNFQELTDAVERVLWATSPADGRVPTLDLRVVVERALGLLSPWIKKRGVLLETQLPKGTVTLEGSRDVIQRGLLVMFVEATLAMEPGQTLEIRLEGDGILRVQGAPAHRWLPRVAGIVELIGGGLDEGPKGSIVAIRLPVQTRI